MKKISHSDALHILPLVIRSRSRCVCFGVTQSLGSRFFLPLEENGADLRRWIGRLLRRRAIHRAPLLQRLQLSPILQLEFGCLPYGHSDVP